jgi:hypothetical protein
MSDPKPVPAVVLKTSRFKVPGEGSSVAISVVTIVALVLLWAVVTNLGLDQAAVPAQPAGGVVAVLRIPDRCRQRQAAVAALPGQHPACGGGVLGWPS